MLRTDDKGEDLKVGDVVYIKGVVDEIPNKYGSVKVRYFPRPGYDEYARPAVAPIFLRRSRFNKIRRLFNKIKGGFTNAKNSRN